MKSFTDTQITIIHFESQVLKVFISFLNFVMSQTTSHKMRQREYYLSLKINWHS